MKNLKFYFFLAFCGLICACSSTTSTKKMLTDKATDKSPATTAKLPELPSLAGKKILMVYGGWQGHRPKEYTEKIAEFLRQEGAEVSISPSLAVYEDSSFLSNMDLIIQSVTMDNISPEQAKGLLAAVKKGAVGFAGCHGGTGDAFRSMTAYQYMVGGQFVDHPGGQIDYRVQIAPSDDPVTKGLKDFDLHTEQYYMHVDPNVKVLATTHFSGKYDEWIEGATMPVAWKKYFGLGRVFYFSVGHKEDIFDEVAAAKTILMRGFQWASGSKYQAKEQWLSPVYK